MEPTVDDIYSLLQQSPKYNSNLKKTGNQISVYFSELDTEQRKSKLKEIKEYIKQQLPQYASVVAYNKTTRSGSSIGRIEIGRKSANDIVVFVKPIPKLSIDKNWLLNEEMFPEIAMEYHSYAEEDNSKFNIKLTDGTKVITFKNVNSVIRVGDKNKKPDIKISTTGRNYYISIKLPEFRYWQTSANTSDLAKGEATKVLDNISNIVGTFSRPDSKISVESIESEVIEFCFGGTAENRVDYIVISNFPSKSPSKSFVYDSENKELTVNVDKIYERISKDYKDLQKKCYMLIEKNRAYNINNKYRGFKISYVSERVTWNTLPGKR